MDQKLLNKMWDIIYKNDLKLNGEEQLFSIELKPIDQKHCILLTYVEGPIGNPLETLLVQKNGIIQNKIEG